MRSACPHRLNSVRMVTGTPYTAARGTIEAVVHLMALAIQHGLPPVLLISSSSTGVALLRGRMVGMKASRGCLAVAIRDYTAITGWHLLPSVHVRRCHTPGTATPVP